MGACAFLSCVKADMKRVPAVCLQEDRKTESLNLLIAVNKRNHDSERDHLQKMKTGFENVFKQLRRVETGRWALPCH